MGLIFEKQPPQAAPLSTVRQQLDVALRMEKPADEAQIDQQVDNLTAGAAAEEGGASFRVKSWGVVLFLLFITGVFVGLAIVLDWKDIVDDPAAYTRLAGTALGATLGYITGDAVGTATS